jgi:hypothetical protein
VADKIIYLEIVEVGGGFVKDIRLDCSNSKPRGLAPARRRTFLGGKVRKTPAPRGGHGTLDRSATSFIAPARPDTGPAVPTVGGAHPLGAPRLSARHSPAFRGTDIQHS